MFDTVFLRKEENQNLANIQKKIRFHIKNWQGKVNHLKEDGEQLIKSWIYQ